MKPILIFIAFTFLLQTAKAANDQLCLNHSSPSLKSAPYGRWLQPPANGEIKGMALMTHGLNTKPEAMIPAAKILISAGYEVFLTELTSSRNSIEEMRNVTAKMWRDDFLNAHCEVQEKAKEKTLPTVFVGYSLGGALYYDRFPEDSTYSRLVMFAPAINVKWYTRAVKFLFFLGGDHIIDSWNPEDYRAHPGTSVNAYKALFEIVDPLEPKKLSSPPTLIVIDKRDELVDAKRIINRASINPKWTILPVDNSESKLQKTIHHLIIDEVSLGVKQWQNVTRALKSHLSL